MKSTSLLFAFIFFFTSTHAQTIAVSGECMSGTITLNKTTDYNGKVAYTGTGTVMGIPNTPVSIYWETPENVWVLAYDGQPYFMSSCNRSTPPSTSNASCSWSEVAPGSCTGSTDLSITGTGTLPVRLKSFTATKLENSVLLNWTTAAEINNKGFEVQRSSNGSEWKKLVFIKGAGNTSIETNYRFEDATPIQGKNYYRLVQYDFDERTTYSPIVIADISGKGFYTLQQRGNGLYQVTIETSQPAELTVVDLSGRKLMTKTAAQGVHQIDISSYAKGIYLLQLRKDNQQLATEKLIKN